MNKKDIMLLAKEVTTKSIKTNEITKYNQRGIMIGDNETLKIIIKKLYENPTIKFNDVSIKEEYKHKISKIFDSIVNVEVLFIGETLAIDIKNNKTSEQYIYEILMLVISINENNEICFVEPMILFYPIDNKEEFNKKFNFPPFKIKNVSKTRIIEINSYTIDSHEHNFIRHDVETTINKKIQLLMDDRGNFSYHDHNTIVDFYKEIIEILNNARQSKYKYVISKNLESLDQLNNYKM